MDYSELKKIRDSFLAGKDAFDEEQISELMFSISHEMQGVYEKDYFTKELEVLNLWLEIFESAVSSRLQDQLMRTIPKSVYFNFGSYVHQVIEEGSGINFNFLSRLVYGYLNLFRHSVFLKRIYGESQWELLIEGLIRRSRFTFSKLFNQRLKQYKDKTLFQISKGDETVSVKWKDFSSIVEKYRSRLLTLTGSNRDVKVAFLMQNCLEMAEFDIACLTGGIVNVMIPANSVPQHIEYILNETEAKIVIVHDEKQLSKIKSVKKELKHLEKAVMVFGSSSDEWVISLKEFLELESSEEPEEEIGIDELATIMYTSGTTGEPKGIMFSNLNIVYKRFCRAMAIPEIGDNDKYLSFLPLFHTFGRWLEMTGAIFWGAEYVFMENPSAQTMINNMKMVKPSIFISIPKKWMQLYEKICMEVDLEFDPHSKILDKVKEITGGNLKWGLSAAGYLPPEVFTFFQDYGIELMSGFGMTEATGGITMTPPGQYKPNSLGRALPGISIKLADDGELLIKGGYVMLGYYNQKKEETFDKDAWFPTGDIMREQENGFIEIIDRKKEIYKNIKGETIAPQKIENLFRDFPTIKQVFLAGDHRPFNTVLINPDFEDENLKKIENDGTLVQEYFSTVIVTVNKFLAPFERIVDFRLTERQFSAEEGELTPKGTYKRRVIEKNFNELIEEMYSKDYISLLYKDFELRLPNWFLRETGCLGSDVSLSDNNLQIHKIKKSLTICECDEKNNTIRIGDYCYSIEGKVIDFQLLLTTPSLWLGNLEFKEFCGESIIQWQRGYSKKDSIAFHSVIENSHPDIMVEEYQNILKNNELSYTGLFAASKLLQSEKTETAISAIRYFEIILSDKTLQQHSEAYSILSRSMMNGNIEILRAQLKILVRFTTPEQFTNVIKNFIDKESSLINENICDIISDLGEDKKVIELESLADFYVEKAIEKDTFDNSPVLGFFNLFAQYGFDHPTMYEHLRQVFVKYQLFYSWKKLNEIASDYRKKMRIGFRDWLGKNQKVAVDLETGEEYRWKDVITLEEDIPEEDKKQLITVITETPIIREAIFLFSKGKLIRLNNILPGGIWISHLRSYHQKSVYRISVQTNFLGSFDLVLNLNKNIEKEKVIEEVNWLILAGSRHFLEELLEDFGGYWEEYNVWSSNFVSGDTVEKFLVRSNRNLDAKTQTRLYYLWSFFVWNASAAYFNYWRLTGYRQILADPSPQNFIIPLHDYQTGTKVVSISGNTKFNSISDMMYHFYSRFVREVEQRFSFVASNTIWNYVFSGIINAEGDNKGRADLEKFADELEDNKQFENAIQIRSLLIQFLENTGKYGFMPKPLYFASKRFIRWYSLNKEADLSARAQTLSEIFDTYNLAGLEESYPGTRTRFFLETVFINSPNDLKQKLRDIIAKQHSGNISKDEYVEKIGNIQTELNLNESDDFFLTRLSFPHLKPADSAALLLTKWEGSSAANLVVKLIDYEGNPFFVREPISPKEISRLHQLFIESNLIVTFREEHRFIVAVSDRGYIIGGLFYLVTGDDIVHMEKIVVSDRYRKNGISEGIMNEFFNRMRSNKIRYVTTGFFRPEYFYRFGFTIERKYSGLVKDLEPEK